MGTAARGGGGGSSANRAGACRFSSGACRVEMSSARQKLLPNRYQSVKARPASLGVQIQATDCGLVCTGPAHACAHCAHLALPKGPPCLEPTCTPPRSMSSVYPRCLCTHWAQRAQPFCAACSGPMPWVTGRRCRTCRPCPGCLATHNGD